MPHPNQSNPSDKENILHFLENDGNDIKFINLLFSDILGELRGFEIPTEELEESFIDGKGFDGSSIEGLARIEESDILAFPQPDTFLVLPWNYSDPDNHPYRVACLFCDIMNPDRTHYLGDTRYVLKKMLQKSIDLGFSSFKVGPEMEFFYFKGMNTPEILDKGDYFSMGIGDQYDFIRKKTALSFKKMGIITEYCHHEVAPSQHEIDLKYMDALRMADTVMLSRFIIKEIARREGIYATFMPKPLDGENGSGMHVHQSLWNNKKNAFFSDDDNYHLSDIAKKYLAGLLTHIVEITSILNQWVNSYKRLVPGFEAPVYISWGQKNRSALIRIPCYKIGKEEATRIELRSPDPACNPYLAFSAMLASGLTGIENDYELPPALENDIYEMSEEEKHKGDITCLPGTLEDALEKTANSILIKNLLGEHIFEKFLLNKRIQIDNYKVDMGSKYDTKVSPFEIRHNYPRL